MKQQKIYIIVLTLFIIGILAGCVAGPTKVRLDYKPSIILSDIGSNKNIGVFSFADNREEIDPKAYGTIVKLVTAELPIAYKSDIKTETVITDYITNAFRNELKSLGFQIIDRDVYSRALPFREVVNNLKELELGEVDKIIIGRIRFFRWTEAGFAGALFQGLMPKPRLNAEIQVQVIDHKSMKILWAGSGWALEKSTESFPKNPERENKIKVGLNKALTQIIRNDGFIGSLL
ncbi:MAG: hypothetical protein KKI12_09955 [Proteobacteria bacterium]|nr:hypothetical protein [Pseudomonadota bacterium]MBU4260166.1 hypothetical protein [Pseudomonadota bacterium]MBU4288478.1 hypothetical protein [Pseudomonadota bacterium]MBU4414689.1 hypothetical protein [Pseudomonadota bacterium]MCG2759185.1 hypothetical protein [Desulfobacteraceae bacterium]